MYWGCASSGKTTLVDTLHQIIQEDPKKRYESMGELTKIAMASGATHYFDRGILKDKAQPNIFYHVYTVAGQHRFKPLREKVFVGADAVIFVFDAQKEKMEENKIALRELKALHHGILIRTPMVVVVNKHDLHDLIDHAAIVGALEEEGFFFPSGHASARFNPKILDSIALRGNSMNVYESFNDVIALLAQEK